MSFPRRAGVLLHPTSLPGPHGIGELGSAAHDWVEFLERSRMKLWQVLPLGPTGFGDSPYQSFSSFAGNPYLVSPKLLVEDGLLLRDDLAATPGFAPDTVDFGPVIAWKLGLLARAFERFEASRGPIVEEFEAFASSQRAWLDDFALFMALKESLRRPWIEWDESLLLRRPGALAAARERLAGAVAAQRFRQFLFFRQW